MKEVIIFFATPKPVVFRETMGSNFYDEELSARTNGKILVSGYDAGKYADDAELTRYIKDGMTGLIENSLKVMSKKSVMTGDTRKRLADEMKKELMEEGIEAEVEVHGFMLDELSQEKYDEMKKEVLRSFAVDRTDRMMHVDRPAGQWIGSGPVRLIRDKFCRQCGNRLGPADNFCTNCGTAVTAVSKACASDQNAGTGTPPSDEGLKMLIDCCSKKIATGLGDGHDETILYLDESTGQYQIHTYAKTPGCPEYHRAYMSDECVYRKVLDKIYDNGLIDLSGGSSNGMTGGEYVVKFVINGLVTRVSTANIPYDKMNRLYEVGALLDSCIDRTKEISGD